MTCIEYLLPLRNEDLGHTTKQDTESGLDGSWGQGDFRMERWGRRGGLAAALTPFARAGAVVCSNYLHPLWFPAERMPTRALEDLSTNVQGEDPHSTRGALCLTERCATLTPLPEGTRCPGARTVAIWPLTINTCQARLRSLSWDHTLTRGPLARDRVSLRN